LAYIDTDTCAYCHGDTDADTDCNPANTYCDSADGSTGSDSHGSTDPYSNRDPANGDASADSHGSTYRNADGDPANGDTSSNCYASTDAYADFSANTHAYPDEPSTAGDREDCLCLGQGRALRNLCHEC
jgi:hypothetical protein